MAGNKQQQQQQQKQVVSSHHQHHHHRANGNGTTGGNGTTTTTTVECFNCHRPIRERYLLKALDQYWHEDCLKCSCCDCRLGEVGSTLFTKANLILCKRDYLRLFGNTGFCSACNKTIPGFEMVMRAKSNVYHLECFSCFQCHQKFCVGDRFYLHENKILCEYDFEERMVFANMGPGRISVNPNNNHHLPTTPPGMMMINGNHQSLHSDMIRQPPAHHQHSNNNHHHHHHVTNGIIKNSTGPKPDGSSSLDAMSCDVSSGYGSGDSPFDH